MKPVAIVTGASSGIGMAIAKRLGASGHHVVLVARRADALATLASSMASAEVLAADLASEEGVAAVAARIERGADVVINCAGFGQAGVFADLDIARESDVLQVNVVAVVQLTHAALRAMRPSRRGVVVNVASLAAFQPCPYLATYGATKAFLTSFGCALDHEMKGTGVRVVTLCPGYTRSGFQEANGVPADHLPSMAWQTVDEVAETTMAAIGAPRAIVIPGWMNWLSSLVVGFVPTWMAAAVSARTVGIPKSAN